MDKESGADGLKNDSDRFYEICSGIGAEATKQISKLRLRDMEGATELRFRTGWPPEVYYGSRCRFIGLDGSLRDLPGDLPALGQRELADIFRALCGYSVHSHQEELRRGFVTIRGGHRAGICGTAVGRQGSIQNVRDMTSINIRIAREMPGAADGVIKGAFADGLCGLLVIGPPCSGKTTVLRDIARQLSYGRIGRYVKTTVIDERGELAAVWHGRPQNDLGPCCDILDGWGKPEGIEAAVRALSPEVVICDEIGSEAEARAMLSAVNCGVKFVAAVHADSFCEAVSRRGVSELISSGVFTRAAVLKNVGGVAELLELKGAVMKNEGLGSGADIYGLHGRRADGGTASFPA